MGDLSRTVSESLGDFLQKWGIPAIPRPRINTVADDNFIFHENGRKLSKRVKNTVGKGEIARQEQFLLFPQWFSNVMKSTTVESSLSGMFYVYFSRPLTSVSLRV